MGTQPAQTSKGLNIALWVAQTLIFFAFVVFGSMKLFMPVEKLAAMWIWPGQVPVPFLKAMGLIDIAGGVGVFLPAVTKIKPRLVVTAALCCIVLQLCAIAFHAYRGEFSALPLNVILISLVTFIWWGRSKKVPFAA